MTPLGQGPRGYGDWQRVVNWDGPLVYDVPSTARVGVVTTPTIETSRYAYLAGVLEVGENPVQVHAQWFADEKLTKQVGQRQFFLDPLILAASQLRLPNLGPWFAANFNPAEAGTAWKQTARLFLTNRVHPLEYIPLQTLLLDATDSPAGAEAFTHYPLSYYSGPLRYYFSNVTAGGSSFVLQTEVLPGVWHATDEAQVAAERTVEGEFVAPTGAWRILVVTVAAGTVVTRLTATTTGAL